MARGDLAKEGSADRRRSQWKLPCRGKQITFGRLGEWPKPPRASFAPFERPGKVAVSFSQPTRRLSYRLRGCREGWRRVLRIFNRHAIDQVGFGESNPITRFLVQGIPASERRSPLYVWLTRPLSSADRRRAGYQIPVPSFFRGATPTSWRFSCASKEFEGEMASWEAKTAHNPGPSLTHYPALERQI
jgi:hypothetical protein